MIFRKFWYKHGGWFEIAGHRFYVFRKTHSNYLTTTYKFRIALPGKNGWCLDYFGNWNKGYKIG